MGYRAEGECRCPRRRRRGPGLTSGGSGCGEGVVDGGDERGRGGGPQGPVRPLPLELRAAVDPPGRQGQRARRPLAGQESACSCRGGRGEEEGGQGRRGDEDGHVPQLLGS